MALARAKLRPLQTAKYRRMDKATARPTSKEVWIAKVGGQFGHLWGIGQSRACTMFLARLKPA
eukprot:8303799-Alexandrium_andersonii.AAC.1